MEGNDNLKIRLADNKPAQGIWRIGLVVLVMIVVYIFWIAPAEEMQENVSSKSDLKKLTIEAEVMMKEGNFTKALEILEIIIRDYPGTFEANQAQQKLRYVESMAEQQEEYEE